MANFALDLETFWFLALGFFWIGYLVLEGFDFGVGMLLPFLGKDDKDRRVIINTIGPHWDGNEVWIITAGAGTFAAFPQWYATLFSAYFLPLLIIVLSLVVRAVAFEYRGKHHGTRWRANWDRLICLTSLLPALLWGVALTGIINGVPIGSDKQFTGNFFDLVQPYALMGGLVTLTLCLLCGAVFLGLKTHGELRERARTASARIAPIALAILLVFALWTTWGVLGDVIPNVLLLTAASTLVGAVILTTRRGTEGWSFLLVTLTIAFAVGGLFVILYPNVMVSSTSEAFNLTIYNAASGSYTLTVMTIVALIMLPIVLFYQAATYYVFRGRIDPETMQASPSIPEAVSKVADKVGITEEHPPQSSVDPPTA